MVQVLCQCGLWWAYHPGNANYCMFCGTPGKDLVHGNLPDKRITVGRGETPELESVVQAGALGGSQSGSGSGAQPCYT